MALIVVVVIMIGVVFLNGNSFFAFFPFVNPSQIEWGPEAPAAISAFTITAIITVVGTFAALIGSWLYTQSRQAGSEGQ